MKKTGFLYTVGVHCDFNDYVLAHPSVSIATANIHKAALMSAAYVDANGGEAITEEELRAMQLYEFEDLMKKVAAAEEASKKRTVETVEKKQK